MMKMVMDIWQMMTVMTTMPVFSQMQKSYAMVSTTIATVKLMKMSKLPSMLMQMTMTTLASLRLISGRSELAMRPAAKRSSETPTATKRAPEFNEQGDEILQELGYDWDRIVELKAAGAVT